MCEIRALWAVEKQGALRIRLIFQQSTTLFGGMVCALECVEFLNHAPRMSRITQKIAVRLFVLIASLQTVILLGLIYAVLHVQQAEIMSQTTLSAARVSNIIARSTRYSMLLNRKEDVHNIIASIGEEPGIQEIAIYNKQGVVTFGTDQSRLNTHVDFSAEACRDCHSPGGLTVPEQSKGTLSHIFTAPGGVRLLGMITPIRNAENCSLAECHAHPESKTILGVIDVRVSLADADRRLAESRNQLLLLSAAAVILVASVAGAFLWVFIRRPVRQLMSGMEMVANGNLDHRIRARGSDEFGQLARAFNDMTGDLATARREITAWSETLEQKVRRKTADLENAHRQMVRVEKMASLGNLASSVAHELNNPLEGILTFARLISKRLGKSSLPREELETYEAELKLIGDEAMRCGNIVKNLLVFARQRGLAFTTVRFRDILARCVMLVQHHAQMNGVEVTGSCTENDAIECDADQIQQVLIALIMNAFEAMGPLKGRPEKGRLTITAEEDRPAEALKIRVADNGMGMPEDVKARVFEPFFTTKSEGKGVGLGLAITYGIVERHQGSIDVESAVGVGTTFTITLPVRQPSPQKTRTGSVPVEGALDEQE